MTNLLLWIRTWPLCGAIVRWFLPYGSVSFHRQWSRWVPMVTRRGSLRRWTILVDSKAVSIQNPRALFQCQVFNSMLLVRVLYIWCVSATTSFVVVLCRVGFGLTIYLSLALPLLGLFVSTVFDTCGMVWNSSNKIPYSELEVSEIESRSALSWLCTPKEDSPTPNTCSQSNKVLFPALVFVGAALMIARLHGIEANSAQTAFARTLSYDSFFAMGAWSGGKLLEEVNEPVSKFLHTAIKSPLPGLPLSEEGSGPFPEHRDRGGSFSNSIEGLSRATVQAWTELKH